MLSLWLRKVPFGLATKPLLGGVTALTGPHTVFVRPRSRALGPMLSSLNTHVGDAEFRPPLFEGV
jgi:hypothetical protein